MTVGIVTDSAASLPGELIGSSGVVVVPLHLTVGDQSLIDGELPLDELVARIDEGLTTSSPSPGEFARGIEDADGGDGVLVLTLASGMSSTYGAARLAVDLAEETEVEVLDTGTAAGAQGLVVLAAAQAAASAGADLASVRAAAERAIDRVRLVATLPTLDHLARGGRVPDAAAWAGRWLGLSPVFEFRAGHVRPHRPGRGPEAAQARIVSMWEHSKVDGAALHVAVMHAADPEGAEHLRRAVCGHSEPASLFTGSFSPVMVAHTGPGLVGLAWWWERPEG